MDLKQWCQLDEQIYIAEMDERYKQHAGLCYNERIIERLAEMRTISAETFVNFFSQPRELVLSSLENIADSSTKKLELKLYNLRNEKIISSRYKFRRTAVNWSTWRQFNSMEKDPKRRNHVFDEFISKTKYISLKELHNEPKSERKCRLAFSQSKLEIQANSGIISRSSEKTSHLQII